MTPHAVALLLFIQVLGSSISVESLGSTSQRLPNEPSNIGDSSNTNTHPWLATIMNGTSRVCSGSIVSKSIILTSASCGFQIDVDTFRVWVGGSSHEIKGLRAILDRQKFDRFVDHDIALIRVTPPIEFNKNVREILLPVNGSAVDENTFVGLPSWVMTTEGGNGRHEDHIDITTLRIANNVKCSLNQGYGGSNGYGQLCAVLKHGRVCQEDSGGPLVSNGVVLGIIPWTSDCKSTNGPRIYVKVSSYTWWLESNVQVMQTISTVTDVWDTYIVDMFWPMAE